MATLPKIEDLGPRPVMRPQRGVARVSSRSVVGEAVQGLGNQITQTGEVIYEREATAAAKERDTYVSDQIRELLYNPESGYLGSEGRNAATMRDDVMGRLKRIEDEATKGLNNGAKEKLQAQLARRMESANNTIDRHAMGGRKDWVNGASAARITAAGQDAVFDMSRTEESLATIRTELRDTAAREGWGADELNLKMREAEGSVYADQVRRMANVDPIAALEYMGANKDKLSPDALVRLEGALVPEAKRWKGREAGQRAYSGASIDQAVRVASSTLGMNETEQREALAEYMRDGGVNLDPAKTAWCAAFINATLAKSGFEGTGSNMARSFLDWGVATTAPKPGDVVVLERGEPPFGHVGLYDGRNPNGTIRILGGNQGGAANGGGGVSIASYSPSRVLGYRRADAGQGTGMDAILDIPDPIEREAALNEFNLRSRTASTQAEARQAQAAQSAYEIVIGGGSVTLMSAEDKNNLGRSEMASLLSLQNTLASGDTVQTDPTEYVRLMEMYSNPERRGEFLAQKPLEWAGSLSQSDWEGFVNKQAEVRKGTATSAPSISTIMTTSDASLRAAGIVKNDNPEQYAAFQAQMAAWAEANPEDAGSPTALQAEISRRLMPVVLDPKGFRNKQSGRLFEIDLDGDPLDPDDDVTPQMLRGGALRFNDKTVSNDLIEEFATAFEGRFGRVPTVEELIDGMAASGLF